MTRLASPRFHHYVSLRAEGLSRTQIARGVQIGALIRVRRGRYVRTDCSPEALAAARLGGRVDCVSLLVLLGVFVLRHQKLHVQFSNGDSRLPPRGGDVVPHWRATAAAREELHADVIEALAQSCICQEPRAAIATLDSALCAGLLDDVGLAEVFSRLPKKYRALRPLVNGRAESGPETIARLMLRALGCTVDVQVHITGVGRVDLVVDGWLIVECDSKEFHSSWKEQLRDRRRDQAAAARGYATHRLAAEDVMYRPERVLQGLRGLVATGRRLHNSSRSRTGTGRPRLHARA